MERREADRPETAHVERLARDGWTVLPAVLDHDACDRLLEALDEVIARLGIGPGTNGFEGHATVRAYNLLAHGPLFEAIPVHPAVLPVVEAVLDRGCLVSSLSSIDIGPGETAQPIHADDQLLPLPKPHVPIVCNTMWALTDFTEANGATRLISGTHLADSSPVYGQHYDSVAAEMPRGSVLVWNGSLWHGGGANTTGERRVGIAMNYCAGWVRQQENQQLGLDPALVATFPDRLRELVGYGIYNGLVGHVDKQSPARLLDAGRLPVTGARVAPGSGEELVWSAG